MKKLLLFIVIVLSALGAHAQITRDSLVGQYVIYQLYMNDSLFYDKSGSIKADGNILNEKIAPMCTRHDTDMVINLFTKDIRQALSTTFDFFANGEIHNNNDYSMHNNGWCHHLFNRLERWDYDAQTNEVLILSKGNVVERLKVTRNNKLVLLTYKYIEENITLVLARVDHMPHSPYPYLDNR